MNGLLQTLASPEAFFLIAGIAIGVLIAYGIEVYEQRAARQHEQDARQLMAEARERDLVLFTGSVQQMPPDVANLLEETTLNDLDPTDPDGYYEWLERGN